MMTLAIVVSSITLGAVVVAVGVLVYIKHNMYR